MPISNYQKTLYEANMTTNKLLNSLRITKTSKADKKHLQRFYRSCHYSARFIGFDTSYFITIEGDDKEKDKSEVEVEVEGEIIAAVIISNITIDNPTPLLHALVVKNTWQHQGIASYLLGHVIEEMEENNKQGDKQKIVCFANEKLSHFYLKNGFSQLVPQLLNSHLHQRYLGYQAKQKLLKVFQYSS